MYNTIFDRLRIDHQVAQVTGQAEHLADREAMLEDRIRDLERVIASMWKLMEEKIGCTEDELHAVMSEIPANRFSNSALFAPNQLICPACGKPSVNRRIPKCLYCGADMAGVAASSPAPDVEESPDET